jgi:hypothetical protein
MRTSLSRPFLQIALSALSFLTVVARVSTARAGVEACVNAHGDGQLRRDESNFTAARELFQSCAKPDCPEPIRVECGEFLVRLEELTPTVLVTAVDARGTDVTDATVELDGRPFLEGLTGRASAVNPGKHTFVFRRPDGTTTETSVLVVEGAKGRSVVGRFPAPAAPKARPAPPPLENDEASGAGNRTLAYVLGGAGVVALASFGYFALSGRSRESELEKACKPHCTPKEARSVQTKYLLADASLLAGVGLLGAGAYLYLSAPDEPKQGLRGFAVGYAGRF